MKGVGAVGEPGGEAAPGRRYTLTLSAGSGEERGGGESVRKGETLSSAAGGGGSHEPDDENESEGEGEWQGRGAERVEAETCDAVIIAAPLETADVSIDVPGVDASVLGRREYQKTHVTFVRGVIDHVSPLRCSLVSTCAHLILFYTSRTGPLMCCSSPPLGLAGVHMAVSLLLFPFVAECFSPYFFCAISCFFIRVCIQEAGLQAAKALLSR